MFFIDGRVSEGAGESGLGTSTGSSTKGRTDGYQHRRNQSDNPQAG